MLYLFQQQLIQSQLVQEEQVLMLEELVLHQVQIQLFQLLPQRVGQEESVNKITEAQEVQEVVQDITEVLVSRILVEQEILRL